MQTQTRARVGCHVCGNERIERDEVLDAGVLALATCGRCGHRWTERPLLRVLSALDFTLGEVAEAA